MFLKILQYSQKNTCARDSTTGVFLRMFLDFFVEIFIKHSFLYNTFGGCFWGFFAVFKMCSDKTQSSNFDPSGSYIKYK